MRIIRPAFSPRCWFRREFENIRELHEDALYGIAPAIPYQRARHLSDNHRVDLREKKQKKKRALVRALPLANFYVTEVTGFSVQ